MLSPKNFIWQHKHRLYICEALYAERGERERSEREGREREYVFVCVRERERQIPYLSYIV